VTARRQPPKSIFPDAFTDEVLRRCYQGEPRREVVARAVLMLAQADGNLNPNGTIKNGVGGRPVTRRPS
jgi:hypothetical protein